MNREIKFRALEKKQNIIREDIQAFYGSFWDILKDKNWAVMQFTGLHDKNGKEIYEGDIIEYFFRTNDLMDSNILHAGDVFMDEFMWLVNREDGEINSLNRINTAEVIGNIFLNPELLTK